MSKAMSRSVGRGARFALLAVCILLFALLAVGCSGKGASGGTADQKAMLESVGKFYAAQGALDLPALKAVVYDPTNVSGIATATIPAGATKTEISWKPSGNSILVIIPSQELTLTVVPATSPANAVTLSDGSGQSETIIMKKDGGTWKIDYLETQKANAAKSMAPPSGQTTPSGQTAP